MKRKITDMMDLYRDEGLPMSARAPLSQERIKEKTMKKIETNPVAFRPRIRIAAIAAVIAMLSVTALAATLGVGDLFSGFFAGKGRPLSKSQIEVIDRIGHTFSSGVTSNGATITPVAALADAHVYYLRLRIEGPEGIVLPDLDEDTQCYYQLFGSDDETHTQLTDADGNPLSYASELYVLSDDDPADNVKDFVLYLNFFDDAGLSFNDGTSKVLSLRGLWIQSPDKEYKNVFRGEFTFDIGVNYKSETVALPCANLSYRDTTYGITVRPQMLMLSPLSLSYQCTSDMGENDWILPFLGPVKIVMKDGTAFYDSGFEALPEGMDIPVQPEESRQYASYIAFETPLNLAGVDYVQYADHVIDIDFQ